MYKYIHTCIYIHISCPHTYTHTHIYTHAYKMYIWTHAKHVWNDGTGATAREAQLDTKKLCPSPCPHHDSVPSRPHPLICTGVEPIRPFYCPRQLPPWPWPPETRSFFCHFGRVFSDWYVYGTGPHEKSHFLCNVIFLHLVFPHRYFCHSRLFFFVHGFDWLILLLLLRKK